MNDVRLLVRAGDMLHGAGHYKRAAEQFTLALGLRPDDQQIRERLEAARAKRP